MQKTLKEYWNKILLKYCDINYADELFNNLILQYSNKNRHYHNYNHIEKMLSLSEEFSNKLIDIEVLQLSIFYHDIIYNSLSKTNELDSAKMAIEQLSKTTFSAEKIKLVEQFILSTQKHYPLIEDSDLSFFLDFDLSILGAEKSIYEKYAKNIKDEYKWVPSYLYKKNRKKVLHHFLEREQIYFTEIFKNKYEKIARENIKFEIDEILK